MNLLLPLLAASGFVIAAALISLARGKDELDRITRDHATHEASYIAAKDVA